MSIGSWDPQAGQASQDKAIDKELLRRFLTIAKNDEMDNLATTLTTDDQKAHALMLAGFSQWQAAVEPLSDAQLIDLMRFFSLVEMQLPDWYAGPKSPVIHLNKILRQRGGKLDTATLQWMRAHSTNRFIPNGAVL